LNTANLLTALRIVLIFPFLLLIDSGRYGLALGTFFLASITDFFDGYIARRFAQQTRLGRLLDPLADKLLVSCAYIFMALPRPGLPSIPMWLAGAVVGRDIMILAGSLIVYLATRFKDFKPSTISKANTTIELGFIVYFLSVNAKESLSFLRPIQPVCYAIVALSVLASGVDYAIKGTQILRQHQQ
jgi:cardiolipin synthase (CMP-forming)